MTQPHILELARQGDPQAIADLMNQSLQPRGMTAIVERQGDLLEVVLEAERVPSREALTAFVQKGIANLGVESIRMIRIVGQQTGAMLPAWMQELDLTIDSAQPDSAQPDLQAAPSVEVEPTVEEPTGAALEPLASFNESAEEEPLRESLPDALELEGLDFEEQLNSREPLSADPQQRHLEAQLENLWAEQSIDSSPDYGLSLDDDESISEEEFQDLFAEDLLNPQDSLDELSSEPTVESVNSVSSDRETDADLDNLFGEQVFSPGSSDLAEYSFDLGDEPESSAEISSDFFLDDPLDNSLNDSLYDANFDESEVDEIAQSEDLSDSSKDLFSKQTSDSAVDLPDESVIDAAIADLFVEETPEPQLSESQLEGILTDDASENAAVGDDENALDFPEPVFPEPVLPEPDLELSSEFPDLPLEASNPGDSVADETQSIPSDLFTEELQGLNETPIEYVFGETIESPIAQNSSQTATEDLDVVDLFSEPLPQRNLPLPLLEEQLDNLWAEQGESSFELEEEPLFPDEPSIGIYEQPDFFGQPEEDSLTFGSESILSESTGVPDRSNESDLINPNAVLLDLPSEGLPLEDMPESLFSEDLPEDLFSEGLTEPIASEDFSLDLSDNPLDEDSDSLFQSLSEEPSEEFFLDDTNSVAALSLDDLEEEGATPLDTLDLIQEDTFIDDALIDSAIASLPAEFLNDSFSEQFENPPETPLEIESSAASADIDLSDFSDFSDNLPDEPLASLIHETSSDDLGIEFLNEDRFRPTDLELDMPYQPIESTSEASFTRKSLEDSDLDLPLDFLGDRTTSSSLRYLPEENSDTDLDLDDDFLNLPDDLLDDSTDAPLEDLFPESAPIDRQSFSIDFLQEDNSTEAKADELPEQADEPLTELPIWDDEIGSVQGSVQGSEDPSLREDNLAAQNLDYALDRDLDHDLNEDIGNLSLELDPEVYTAFDEPWLDPLNDEVRMNQELLRSSVTEVDWDLYADSPESQESSQESQELSQELSQEQLEAQLEEFDRNSAPSENYGTGNPNSGNQDRGDRTAEDYAEGNGQIYRSASPTVDMAENSDSSWLLTAALVGMSSLVAGLLGYVLWSKVVAPPAPQPVTPAPIQPSVSPSSVLPSAPSDAPAVPSAAPPAEPTAPPESPVP